MKRTITLILALSLSFAAGYRFAWSQMPKDYIIKPGPAMTEKQLRDSEPWRNK